MWRMPDLSKEFFSGPELAQVSRLFDQILPRDRSKGFPGAGAAGAPEFLNRLLALDASVFHAIPGWAESYRLGLKGLDRAALEALGRPLADTTDAECRDLLGRLERGRLEGVSEAFDQRAFFRMLRMHCLQGCFADPRWHGNRDKVMWRWLGWIEPAQSIPDAEVDALLAGDGSAEG